MTNDEMKPTIRPFTEKPLTAWCELLRSSPDAEERYRALQAITVLADPAESVHWLRSGLDDLDSAVRAGAARWLASRVELTPRPGSAEDWNRIAERWAQLLSDDDPDVRFESARGVMQIDPANAAAVRVLAELLSDPETQPAMVAAILKVYRTIDRKNAIPTPEWLRWLRHDQSALREEAVRTLAHWGAGSPNLAQDLVPLLDDEDPFVREEAAKSLGAIGVSSPDIIAAWETATSDDDEIVAAAATASLRDQKARST
jgi:HEAT repeat protein